MNFLIRVLGERDFFLFKKKKKKEKVLSYPSPIMAIIFLDFGSLHLVCFSHS